MATTAMPAFRPDLDGCVSPLSGEPIDLEAALRLLSLPRTIGPHPETGQPIVAGIGRYGPFVEHGGKYANLDSVDDVFTVGQNRAVSLLAEKQAGRSRTAAATLKDLGEQIDEASKREIEDAIKEVTEAVKGEDADDIRAKTDRLNTAFHRVSEQMYERAQAEQAAQAADAPSENGASSSTDEEVVDAEVVDEQK